MRTAGEVPGLRFLEGEDDDLKSSARHRIRSIFSTPPEYDAEALDTGEGGYDDLSGAGWTAEDGGLEEEDIDDLGEILIIVGIGCFIMGLLWLRGRWAVWAEERRLREAADRDRVGRGQEGVDGVQVAVQREGLNGEVGVGGVVPEPIINAPIP